MMPTWTLHEKRDGYTALMDVANMLSFIKETFDQSRAMDNGEDLTFSAQAVAGCAILLESIIDGIHKVAETDRCGCACHTEKGGM